MNATTDSERCYNGSSTSVLYFQLTLIVLLTGLISYLAYSLSKERVRQFLVWIFFAVFSLPFLIVMTVFWVRSKSYDLGLYGQREQAYIAFASIIACAWLWGCAIYFNLESDLKIFRSLNFLAAIMAAIVHGAFYIGIVFSVYYCSGMWDLHDITINYTTLANICAAMIILTLVVYLAFMLWIKNADIIYRRKLFESNKINNELSPSQADIFTAGNYGYDLSPEAVERMKNIEEIQKSRARGLNNEMKDMNVYANQLFDESIPAPRMNTDFSGDAQLSVLGRVKDPEASLETNDGFRTIELDIEEPHTKNANVVSRIKAFGDQLGTGRNSTQPGLGSRTKLAIKEKFDEKKRAILAVKDSMKH